MRTHETSPRLQIRRATPADLDLIVDFNLRLAEESEGKRLDPAVVHAGVRRLLDDSVKGVYHLAEVGGEIVGQVCYTYEWSDWRNGWFWWIQSVYVRADFRGRGVFRSLFTHLASLAREQGDVIGIRLYVEEQNHAAQQVYTKLGFSRPGYFVLERGFLDPPCPPPTMAEG
jgi:GNAT superfamily N-acetyltransferase